MATGHNSLIAHLSTIHQSDQLTVYLPVMMNVHGYNDEILVC